MNSGTVHSLIIDNTTNFVVERIYRDFYIYKVYNVQYKYSFKRKIAKLVIERLHDSVRDAFVEKEIKNGYLVMMQNITKYRKV